MLLESGHTNPLLNNIRGISLRLYGNRGADLLPIRNDGFTMRTMNEKFYDFALFKNDNNRNIPEIAFLIKISNKCYDV